LCATSMDDATSTNATAENLGKNQRRLIFLLVSFFAPLLLFAPTLFLVRLQNDSKFIHGSFDYVKSMKLRNAGIINGALGFINRAYGNIASYRYIRSVDGWKGIRYTTETRRVGCREYPNGGESCVLEGIACVDLSKTPKVRSEDGFRYLLYLVDDNRRDGETVFSDSYCQKSDISADPKYYGAKEWPPRENYFAPRHSCLNAQWRTKASLFGNRTNPPKVRWLEDTSLMDLAFLDFNQNNHYLTGASWMLDVALWQNLMSRIDKYPTLFAQPKHILFPQRLQDFIKQSNEFNRVNLAIILGLDASELYRGQKPQADGIRAAKPFIDAFPEAKEGFIFYPDEQNKDRSNLVCTKRLSVGARMADLGGERVCNHLRNKTWELFNITLPPFVHAGGYLEYHRPPRRVVLRQQEMDRGFGNIDDLSTALYIAAAEYNFEFEIIPVRANHVEEEVRIYANTGVLLTTQDVLGPIWMPRHSAVVEVHPPGFTDYSLNIHAKTCNLWYFELQGLIPEKERERYERVCGDKLHNPFDHCHSMKDTLVEAPVEKTVETVIKALNRLGHDMTRKKAKKSF